MATGRSDTKAIGPYPLGHNGVVLELQQGDIVSLKVMPQEGGFFSGISASFKSPSDVTFSGHLLFPTGNWEVLNCQFEDVTENLNFFLWSLCHVPKYLSGEKVTGF